MFCCASSRTGRRVRVRSGRRVTGSQQRAPAGPCGPRPQTCPSLPTGEPSGSPRPPRAKPGGSGTDKGCPSPALPCSRIISLPGGFPAPLPISQALLLPWRALPPLPPLCSVFFTPLLGFPGFSEALISGASKPGAGGGGYFRNGREQRLLGLDSCNCHPFYGEKGFAPSPHLLREHQYLPRIWAGVGGGVGCWSS